MRRTLRGMMLILCMTISLLAASIHVAAIEVSNQDDEVVRTIEDLNELRSRYGMLPLEYNEILNKTANTHNKYMSFNDSFSSLEEADKLYYRGRYPWDRAEYAGYEKTYVFEALIKGITTYSSGIESLLQNPYSRYALFDPLYDDLGMNMNDELTTYLFGGDTRDVNKEVIYPYNRQRNVDTTFVNRYIQNPYDQLSSDIQTIGVPITYSLYFTDAQILDYEDVEAELLNTRTNEVVEVEVITSKEDRKLTNSIMILPLENYDYGTTYEINIDGRVRFNKAVSFEDSSESFWKDINYAGTFTTKSTSTVDDVISFLTREKFVVDLMKEEAKRGNYILRDSLVLIYPDVNINDPNYRYIYTAHSKNLITGYPDGYYKPDANINREQAFAVLIRNYKNILGDIELTDEDRQLAFSDQDDISDWALESIYKAKKIGLLVDNEYEWEPQEYLTITEFNKIFRKFMQVSQTTDFAE